MPAAKTKVRTQGLFIDPAEYGNDLDAIYADCEQMIKGLVIRFSLDHGRNVEDMLSLSNELFMRAWRAYNPDKGTNFAPLVRQHVWGGMMDKLRHEGQRNHKLTRQNESHIFEQPNRSEFDFKQYKRSLSRDAAIVVHLTTQSRAEVHAALTRHGFYDPKQKRQTRPTQVKLVVIQELKNTWGWSMRRICSAFNEIRESLKEL